MEVEGKPVLLVPLTLPRRSRAAQAEIDAGGVRNLQTHAQPTPRAGLVPRIGFPRVYPAPVNVGGRRKACPPSPADATPALPGSASGKSRRECPEPPNPRATHAAGRDLPDFYRTLPPRKRFFSWTVHGPFSFWGAKKRMGGAFRRQSRRRPRAGSARKTPAPGWRKSPPPPFWGNKKE